MRASPLTTQPGIQSWWPFLMNQSGQAGLRGSLGGPCLSPPPAKMQENQPFVFIFLSVLGLCCWAQAFSSCGDWRLLSSCGPQASHCGGFPCCGSWTLDHRLSHLAHGVRCPEACGIFQDQGSNPCPLAGRWTPSHWTTREVPNQP